METKYSEPAFPLKEPLSSDQTGMTLRDYFAAKAMHALIETAPNVDLETIAENSYMMADVMMKARGEQ